ncbi:unnamed protein product [Schistocephalus solidus]|uniref:Protein FAM184A n=1 Tax=Schistocephalus solidus TaxID=70667 RepID=A0A183SNP3_SCHSO|nr:unnamed protein product [Schistocephalus solidus]
MSSEPNYRARSHLHHNRDAIFSEIHLHLFCKRYLLFWCFQLKEEVSRLCDVMNTETGPILETLGEKIASLMSKLSTTKQELSKKLQDAHDLLVSQIHDLRERSIQILDKVEQNSLSNIDAQITEIDTLLARIDSICEKSENIEKEQDIGELVKLDTEMTKLQKDIESVQLKVANSKLDNLALNSDKITLENLKINQAYKNIVAQIEETEMLRTFDRRFRRGPPYAPHQVVQGRTLSCPPRCVELFSKHFMNSHTLGFEPHKSSSGKGSAGLA